jgi:hypothetical protein
VEAPTLTEQGLLRVFTDTERRRNRQREREEFNSVASYCRL